MRAHLGGPRHFPALLATHAFLGIGLALSGIGCNRAKEVQVQSDKVQRRNLTETVMATGKVQPVTLVKITPEVAGEIIELPIKEGQKVRKGDLLVRVRRDLYEAGLRSAQASLRSAEAALVTAMANERKAVAEFQRNEELFQKKLVSESVHDDMRTALDVSRANVSSATQQIEMAKASIKRAEEDLLKTTILAPIDGTVTRLASEVGERVFGTGMMAGTEILQLADLAEMEARVEVGEVDVVLIQPGQKARLEVDSFRDRRFSGVVTQVARSAKTQALGTQQESTKFEVRIRIKDKETFLPGMSVTAEIETRYRTNVLSVPIQSITTRVPGASNSVASTKGPETTKPDAPGEPMNFEIVSRAKAKESSKAREVVFVIEDGKARMVPVQRGISDDTHYEVVEGVTEGMEVITGSFRALSRELEDGKPVTTQTNKPGWSFSIKTSAATP